MQVRRVILALLLSIAVVANAETYVVSVGVAHYADSKVNDLTKTENDAAAFAQFFQKGSARVVTLIGKSATKSAILAALRRHFSQASKEDKIIFFFSGHGYPGGFCPYEMSKLADGLTYDEVAAVMRNSRATDKMIFADACNSGAIRQEKKTSCPRPGNVMLFMSSRGSESSIESPFLANGFFTTALLRGLRGAADADSNRKITASELFNYVSKDVRQRSKERQHPVMWGKFDNNLTIVEYNKANH